MCNFADVHTIKPGSNPTVCENSRVFNGSVAQLDRAMVS